MYAHREHFVSKRQSILCVSYFIIMKPASGLYLYARRRAAHVSVDSFLLSVLSCAAGREASEGKKRSILTLCTKRCSCNLHTSGGQCLSLFYTNPIHFYLQCLWCSPFFTVMFKGADSQSECSRYTQTSVFLTWLTTDLCLSACRCEFVKQWTSQPGCCCNLLIKF